MAAPGQKGFYGWKALFGTMLGYFSMVSGTIVSFGIFLPFMSDDLGWSRSALSGSYTVLWIMVGILGPLAGISVSRFGSRKNIIFGHLAIALGLLAMSRAQEVWHVYLAFSLLAGTGQAFGGYIALTTVATNWFIKRRSLAVGLVSAAGGAGALLTAPLLSWLIPLVGWRTGWICLAGVPAVLAVTLGGLLIRNKPEDMGQLPDGMDADTYRNTVTTSTEVESSRQTPADWTAGDALRSPVLWLILTFVAANLFALNFLTLHQVSYLRDMGFSTMAAGTTVGVMSSMSIIGQLTCGVLGMRVKGKYLATACLTSLIIGVTILMNAQALPLIYLHTVLSGIGYGGLLMLQPVIIAAYYGRAHYARIIGWTIPVTTIFSSISPVLAGLIYDNSGSYRLAFIIVLAFLGIGLISSLLTRPPKRPAVRAG